MIDKDPRDTGRLVAAQSADLRRVVDLLNAAYRGQEGLKGWTDERGILAGARTTVELLTAELTRKSAAVLLKWQIPDDDHLTGCILLEPIHAGTWHLGSFAVEPGRQNKGLGQAILSDAERWARERRAACLAMTVITARTELVAWYIRRGYVPTGEIAPFPYGDLSVGVPLRDDLRFAVLEKTI